MGKREYHKSHAFEKYIGVSRSDFYWRSCLNVDQLRRCQSRVDETIPNGELRLYKAIEKEKNIKIRRDIIATRMNGNAYLVQALPRV